MSFATYRKNGDSAGKKRAEDLEEGEQDSVSATLKQISATLAEFISLVSSISKQEAFLGTQRDTPALRQGVNGSIANCQRVHKRLLENIDYLERTVLKSADGEDGSRGSKELMTVKFSKDLLRQQVQDVYKNYQVVVRSYNEKLHSALVQEQYEKTLERIREESNAATYKTALLTPSGEGVHGDGYSSVSEEAATGAHAQTQTQTQTQKQTQKQASELSEASLQYHSDLIHQRDNAITSISQGVQDINKIFKDLDHLVSQQGEQVDSIENNMTNYATNNQLASHELVKADNYQKKKRKWTCVLLAALVIVLLIVLALIS
ncbi:hypothetical protein PICMEDRAFT_59370 [Pichia membranifaciens NRRL Y-2026]|uniref:t-SNARE coiled-coil homology domain-containing protein n=1 Tax=Pichia membranifaciens NRRL Y-2026 TaxID=763406 RepID=A0A1E3NK70_9ASCO|nr:hypothetical protein PICMEDRAFT_59370 [Pichia membranifaciens NRRL Y-2026]ODQ45733.1 hypothetical protein PICMEDRAFT_59370 [Pichia membranifaciens NRRL Y-2026]